MKLKLLTESKKVSKKRAKQIGDKLGIDWNKIDLEEFRMGIEVEYEHGFIDVRTNVTDDDPIKTAKIAWAHLNEVPNYYTKLKKIEK